MNERPLVALCYDHLGGRLAERLAGRLVELGWVEIEPNPGVTPLGWVGFASLGLDLRPLMASPRKPVAACGRHIGGHLGFLLQRHLLAAGWLARSGGQLLLTPAGESALRRLGVNLEA